MYHIFFLTEIAIVKCMQSFAFFFVIAKKERKKERNIMEAFNKTYKKFYRGVCDILQLGLEFNFW